MTHRRITTTSLAVRAETVDSIAVVDVSISRGGRVIVDDVTLRARSGRVLALMGPSGSGKSTLLSLLAGLETPDRGHVEHDGVRVALGVPSSFGLILQGYGLASVLTAAENVEIALQARRLPREQVEIRAVDALGAVGLTAVADHLVEELSGGQQQRVAIARALAVHPAVLIADEPTAELDHDTRGVVLEQLVGLAESGAVVVVATHDPAVAQIADDVVRLLDGRAVTD